MSVLDASIAKAINTATVNNNFAPVPAGEYMLQVEETSVETTRDGTGEYVKVQFSILGPSYQGRRIFSNFNIRNRSSVAEDIGRGQLKMLSDACQVHELRNTDQLLGKTVIASVTIEKNKNPQYPDQNRAGRFRAASPVGAPGQNTQGAPQIKDQEMPTGSSFSSAFSAGNATGSWFK